MILWYKWEMTPRLNTYVTTDSHVNEGVPQDIGSNVCAAFTGITLLSSGGDDDTPEDAVICDRESVPTSERVISHLTYDKRFLRVSFTRR